MMKFMRKKLNKKGFTILELLVVVAIIAILAVIAVPQFLGAIDKSRVSAQIADLNSINKAVVMYNFDTSAFPADISKLQSDTVTGFNGPYMNAVPAKDKWGGNVNFTAISSITATDDSAMNTGAISAATATASGLKVGDEVIVLDGIPAGIADRIDASVDQSGDAGNGTIRLNAATGSDATAVFYIVK